MTLWSRARGSVALLILFVAAACILPLTGTRRVEADGSFISVPGRVDMVYDLKRDTVYISYRISNGSTITESGIKRFHVGSNSFLSTIPIYGSLLGVDLSPDGNTLLVADTLYSDTKIWVHQVDLQTLTVTKAEVNRSWSYEGGTYAVAFGNDGTALVTSTFLGSGWTPLRRYNPQTGVWTNLQDVRQSTMVSASPDRSVIGYAESNISDGAWGSYRVIDGQMVRRTGYTDGTSWFNYEIGTANGGSQYALPTYGGTHIYTSSYAKQTVVGQYAAKHPIGVAYHPFQDIVYFAWADWASDSYSPWVRGHRTTDFGVVQTFDFQNHFDHPGNAAFTEGRLRIAQDASYLFGTVQNGVRFVQLGTHRPTAASQTVRTLEDTATAISLYGYAPGGGPEFQILSSPSLGSLAGTPPNLVYTPAANVSGTDSFTYQVNGAGAVSNTATVQVVITPVNDPPTFVKGADQSVPVGSPAQTVAGWATQISPGPADESGQSLTFFTNTNSVNMFAVQPKIAANGTLTYTPAASAPPGTAHILVTLRDSGGTANGGRDTSTAQTFTITFTASGAPPTAVDDTADTDEDTPVDIDVLANDSDPEGGQLTLASVQAPARGTAQIVAGKARYTPAANFNGSDSFDYVVRDATGLTDTGTVRVTVRPVNDPPSAVSQTVNTAEDSDKAVTLTGSDPDGDPLSFTVVTGPGHGTLSGSAPNLTYTPAPNYNGADSFTFKVSDGQVESGPGTVTINISAVNDAPTAQDDQATTPEDTETTLDVLANDSDPDGDALSIDSVTQGNRGFVQIVLGKIRYVPFRDANGPDVFSYTASDPSGATSTATVRMTITPVNDPPIARGASYITPEDTPRVVTLAGFDPDGDPLSFALASMPANGTLEGTLPNLEYRPNPNFNGADSFTFTVSDGQATSAPATISITVTPVNDAPVAVDDTATTDEDTSVNVAPLANDSDPDGDALVLQSVTQGANGAVEIVGGMLRYTPAADFNGTDSFTYTVNDPGGLTDTATVRVTVNPVNDPPAATPQSISTPEDTPKTVTLAGTDADGSPLTFAIAAGPMHGTLTGVPPNLTYTPAANYHGPDSFSFTVSDGEATSAPATVAIQVDSVNDLPVAVNDTANVPKNTEVLINVLTNDSDPDGDPLAIVAVSAPAHGTATISGGAIRFKPTKNYLGPDSFTYTVSDGKGGTATAVVTVQVTRGEGSGNGNGKGNNR